MFKQDMFHLSLAVANFLEATTALIPTVISIATNGSMRNDLTCTSTGFLTSFLAYTSILHLTLMSLERGIALGIPFSYSRMKSSGSHYTEMMLVFIWSFALLIGILPFCGWSSYTLQKDHGRCSVDWRDDSFSGISYITLLFVLFFLLPITVMVASCITVNHAMRAMYQRAALSLGCKHRDCAEILQGKTKNNKIIAAMSTSFFAAWTPYATCALILTLRFEVSDTMLTVSGCLAKTAVIFNPIIYMAFSRRFRKRTRNVIMKICKKDRTKSSDRCVL